MMVHPYLFSFAVNDRISVLAHEMERERPSQLVEDRHQALWNRLAELVRPSAGLTSLD